MNQQYQEYIEQSQAKDKKLKLQMQEHEKKSKELNLDESILKMILDEQQRSILNPD